MAKFRFAGQALKQLKDADNTLTTAELNALDGLAAELALLDGMTATAAEVNILDGATATVAEINVLDNIPADVTFAYAAGASTIAEVTVTVVDAAGTAIAAAFSLDVWLSDAASGIGLTATSASGTVVAKSASGEDRETVTSKKHLRVQTLVTGIYTLEITDTAKTAFFPAAIVPGTGATAIGLVMATGDYGA